MDARIAFDEDCLNYDRWRPRYTEELFRRILGYARVGAESEVCEIGIGTGQATEPFLKTGCRLTAVEIGPKMAEFVARRFQEYSGFRVANLPFEEFESEPDRFDLLYSATAFHWIPAEVGYAKALRLLRPGGAFAVFWNKPSPARPEEPLHVSIQEIYARYGRERPRSAPSGEERYEAIRRQLIDAGFSDVQMHLFNRTRRFRADEYIGLLNTYSDHLAMPKDKRLAFEREIADAIRRHGDTLSVYDTMDLYLGRKP